MNKNDLMFMRHMNDSVNLIVEFTKDKGYNDFITNIMMREAVIRQIGIIGEAANRLSKDFKKDYPDIEWIKIIGMRNRVVHDYFGINFRIVWETIQNRIPTLKEFTNKFISEFDSQTSLL